MSKIKRKPLGVKKQNKIKMINFLELSIEEKEVLFANSSKPLHGFKKFKRNIKDFICFSKMEPMAFHWITPVIVFAFVMFAILSVAGILST